jgi:hypothetical protein
LRRLGPAAATIGIRYTVDHTRGIGESTRILLGPGNTGAAGSSGWDSILVGPPRTFGARLRYRFGD